MTKTRPRLDAGGEPDEGNEGPGVAIVGTGAVGSSLANSLYASGYRITALINRSLESASALAGETGGSTASTSLSDIPPETRLIFICTRDESIGDIAGRLANTNFNFADVVVAHVSGRLPASILSDLSRRGALALSFHPLGSFPPGRGDKMFAGLTVALEGDELAVAMGRVLAVDLGARPVEIGWEAKDVYHLAASMTSNFLVALLWNVETLLQSSALPPDLTLGLAEDTLDNIRSLGADGALTGPIARADVEAVKEQLRLISRTTPDLLPVFRSIAGQTVRLAVASGRITEEAGDDLAEVLAADPD